MPAVSRNGVSVTLYSGALAGLTSPVHNYAPLIIADITIEGGVTTVQQLPANFNTFLYVIDGDLRVGPEESRLTKDQVGWLDLHAGAAQSGLTLTAGEAGARLVLYAGKPTGDSIISHGPFIGDTSEDIQRLYQDFRRGKMKHITTVPQPQKIVW